MINYIFSHIFQRVSVCSERGAVCVIILADFNCSSYTCNIKTKYEYKVLSGLRICLCHYCKIFMFSHFEGQERCKNGLALILINHWLTFLDVSTSSIEVTLKSIKSSKPLLAGELINLKP